MWCSALDVKVLFLFLISLSSMHAHHRSKSGAVKGPQLAHCHEIHMDTFSPARRALQGIRVQDGSIPQPGSGYNQILRQQSHSSHPSTEPLVENRAPDVVLRLLQAIPAQLLTPNTPPPSLPKVSSCGISNCRRSSRAP